MKTYFYYQKHITLTNRILLRMIGGIKMKCYVHTDVEAIGACTKCGKLICQACATEVNGKLICKQCASSVAAQPAVKGIDEVYCKSCGAVIKREAEICPKCGVRQMNAPAAALAPSGKSRVAAAILAILLGGIGAHKFYLGKIGMGLVYLCFCWTFIPALLGLVEGIIYLMASDAEFEAKYAR